MACRGLGRAALLLMFRSHKHAKGQCFTLYVFLYSLARFGLEFLRGDYTEKVFGLLTSAQTTSSLLMLLSAAAFIAAGIYERKQKRKRKPSPIIAATSKKKKDSGAD